MKVHLPKVVFAFVMALIATGTAAATNALILTGSIVKVTVDTKYKDHYDFRVDLVMQFKNEGDEPVIILRPTSFAGKKRLTFINDYSTISSTSEVEGIPRRPDARHDRYGFERDPIADFFQELRKKEPREYIFAEIPPGGYYECLESLIVENGFKVRKMPGNGLDNNPKFTVIPEFAGLRIEYLLSIGDRPQGIDLLRDAKERWSKLGNLIFDLDGDYAVKSGLILIMPST